MLLSTDWFFGRWDLVGVHIVDQKRRQVQSGCRSIVRDFIGKADDYWHVSFANERIEKTRSAFAHMLQKSGVEVGAASRLTELGGYSATGAFDPAARWAILHLTEMVALGSTETEHATVSQGLKQSLAAAWQRWGELAADCEEESTTSSSEWDRGVRDLTPDLPSTLCDFLQQELVGSMKFDALWGFLQRTLTLEQQRELLDLYRHLARSLGMNAVEMPSLTQ